ncbi:hypothetical protein [Tolypothrix sp. VBCCA 56010]
MPLHLATQNCTASEWEPLYFQGVRSHQFMQFDLLSLIAIYPIRRKS